MIRLTLAAALYANALTGQAAHAQTAQVLGEWTGKYICAQGVTALELIIANGPKHNTVTATFNFGPLPENRDIPSGAYQMRGTYDPVSRRVKLDAEKWIEQPVGYAMVGLDGVMSSNGLKITGRVPDLFTCSSFEVWRPSGLIG